MHIFVMKFQYWTPRSFSMPLGNGKTRFWGFWLWFMWQVDI
jgi:hypothetical protein